MQTTKNMKTNNQIGILLFLQKILTQYTNTLVQDCSSSFVNALALLQSCTKQ